MNFTNEFLMIILLMNRVSYQLLKYENLSFKIANSSLSLPCFDDDYFCME